MKRLAALFLAVWLLLLMGCAASRQLEQVCGAENWSSVQLVERYDRAGEEAVTLSPDAVSPEALRALLLRQAVPPLSPARLAWTQRERQYRLDSSWRSDRLEVRQEALRAQFLRQAVLLPFPARFAWKPKALQYRLGSFGRSDQLPVQQAPLQQVRRLFLVLFAWKQITLQCHPDSFARWDLGWTRQRTLLEVSLPEFPLAAAFSAGL